MTDDLMKRSREWLQACVNAATRGGTPEEADLEAFLLAHLDGDAARVRLRRVDGGMHVSDAKPYTSEDVRAWVEMRWERERLDEKVMARIRATVEERDALKVQVANLEAELAQGVEACRAHVCLGAQEAKAERDEAVAALRVAKRWAESGDDSIADAVEYVRSMAVVEAALAKYPEGKR